MSAAPAALRVTLTGPDGVQTAYASGSDALEITVEHPRLWQPNGCGAIVPGVKEGAAALRAALATPRT